MSKKYYKLNNPAFTIFTANLLNQSEANKAILKFPPDDVSGLTTDNQSLETELLERQALADALAAKDVSIRETRNRMNKRVDTLQIDAKNNAEVSKSLLEMLGFDTDENKPSSSTPVPPTDLVVTGTSDGVNHLKWKRNGNRQGTLFVIEAKFGDSNAWVIVDVTTSVKYEHKNQTPGVKVQYRIKAKRGDAESTASNIAIVYP